jgi:hypothetical protein
MAFDRDPYRTLGLARGASLEEVKRAYRRLVKAHHPDAAGSAGIARFLAIQAAYEQLVEGRGPGRPARPSSGTSRRASEADPDRSDATRRAYGGRQRARRPSDRPGGGNGARAADGPAAGDQPGGPAADDGTSAEGSPGRPGEPRRGDSGSGRRRGKATLGSTSYDDATTGPFEPDWSGASWYGTTSGTYWTINPREYADPRKHGPEYQARARRAAGRGSGSSGEEGNAQPPDGRDTGPVPGAAAGSRTSAAAGSDSPAGASSGAAAEGQQGGRVDEPVSWWTSTAGSSGPAESTATSATGPTDRRFEPSPPPADERARDSAGILADLARALTDPEVGGARGRVARAVVGWLPIALGIGWLVGEVTGCSRFAATCDPAVEPGILLAQGATLAALFLSPSVAALAAGAAIALVLAAAAGTLVLSATGTAADEGSRRVTLAALLLVAWLGGLAISIAQRVRAVSSRTGPVS